jgi:hypothetical protein
MNKLTLTILMFLGILSLAHADSNGIWIDASDIRGGTFGSDETPGSYLFDVPVSFSTTVNYFGVELDTRYVNSGELNSITSAMIVDSTIVSADILDETITSADLGVDSVGASELVAAYEDGSVYDPRFVNEGQVNSITSTMVVDNSLTAVDLAPNSVGDSELIDNPTVTSLNVNTIRPASGNTVVIQLS